MSSVQPFDFEGTPVRTITYETGQTWWVLSDVAKSLDVQNTTDLAKRLDEDERSRFNLGRQGEAWIINESGLYNVILRSDKPEARRFRKWVTGEVLPRIRRTGGYVPGSSPELIMANAVLIAQKTIEQQKAQLDAQAPKVLFADSVAASDSKILIGDMAKILRQNGVVNMGANRFFQWLRDNGYLIRRQGRDYNSPTQRSQEMGLFYVKETSITHASGFVTVNKTTLVTGKGQQYFVNKFLGDQGIGKAA
ncbi:phage antirepressor Ant [Bifidobacterium psychraerophilum]|uniref:phage antirepressor n=1 Tax=Bifidobacterium psychraerophilum TaxID=218140 RepID=UPI00310DA5F7